MSNQSKPRSTAASAKRKAPAKAPVAKRKAAAKAPVVKRKAPAKAPAAKRKAPAKAATAKRKAPAKAPAAKRRKAAGNSPVAGRRPEAEHTPDVLLLEVRRVSSRARAVVGERDRLIRAARNRGASWGELSLASGLSRSGVRRVCERSDPRDF